MKILTCLVVLFVVACGFFLTACGKEERIQTPPYQCAEELFTKEDMGVLFCREKLPPQCGKDKLYRECKK